MNYNERILWLNVIHQAVEDLNLGAGEKQKEALSFLQGETGSLIDICNFLGINHVAIRNIYVGRKLQSGTTLPDNAPGLPVVPIQEQA